MGSAVGSDLTLVVPGLFGPVPPAGVNQRAARGTLVEGLALDAFESLLSRALHVPVGHEFKTPEDLCFGLLGYRKPGSSDWPVAAVTRHADVGDHMPGWFLRADPVHLKADANDLVLFDGEYLDLDLEEARVLARLIARHLGDADWCLEVPHPFRWYLRLERPPAITTAPLSTARLQPVKSNLPRGEDGSRWRVRMNEIQMLLHECEINEARQRRGQAAVNSLWFWGGGTLPEPMPARYSSMFADAALAEGLGKLTGSRLRPLPAGADGILQQLSGDSVLVVTEAGYGPARSQDVDGWRRFLVDLEQNWLAPVKQALDRGRLTSLTIVSDRPVRFEVHPARWWQRFRRPRSFADLAEI